MAKRSNRRRRPSQSPERPWDGKAFDATGQLTTPLIVSAVSRRIMKGIDEMEPEERRKWHESDNG